MKKLLSLLLTVLMILSIGTAAYALEPDEYKFSATVLTCRYIESTDRYSFCAIGDVYGSGNHDPFTFGVSRDKIKIADGLDIRIEDGLAMGQVISIVFSGEVMESYPMQINPNYIVIEEEIEELTADEQYNYLSMFYTEEWLIENGYMEVPPAEGEAVAPEIECDEDTAPPSENTEWEDGDIGEEDDISDEDLLICGVPLEGDENGKCIVLSGHCLEGFVVATEYFDGSDGAYIYFLASTNFNDEVVTPVRLEISKDTVGLIDIDFYEIESGMNLKIHCTPESYCVASDNENERFLVVDGEILTIEKLEGFTENHSEFESLFFDEAPISGEVGHMIITDKYLEGFVVASEFSMSEDDGSADANTAYGTIYFFAESDFNKKIVNPIVLQIDDLSVYYNDIEFWEIESGVRLRVYCSVGASCAPAEGQIYNKLVGTVVSIQRLEGTQDDYADYDKYFWGGLVDTSEMPDEPTAGGDALLSAPESDKQPQSDNGSPTAEPVEEKSNMTVLWIIGCLVIIVLAVTATVIIIKKK